MNILYVPTIHDRLPDFDALFSFANQAKSDPSDYQFDFSQCQFLRQSAVAFLGGLANLIELNGGIAEFRWNTMHERVFKYLNENGFAKRFGSGKLETEGHSVPYREDKLQDKNSLVNYLRNSWLGRGWVHVSERLQDEIIGKVWEIYSNAFDHGHSDVGVYSCGHHYSRWNELALTVVDFGSGIASNVRSFLKQPTLPADNAIKWAMLPGNTTKPKAEIPGGVGLGIIKDFVEINNGYLEIFSNDGYVYIGSGTESYAQRIIPFKGTMVNIKFKCDEYYYSFISETSGQPRF